MRCMTCGRDGMSFPEAQDHYDQYDHNRFSSYGPDPTKDYYITISSRVL